MAAGTYLPLDLTIRFASSLPDLHLPRITDPATTSALSLLPAIRTSLPPAHASLKIILISSGRVLQLREALSTSIRLPSAKKLGQARVQTEYALPAAHHVESDGQTIRCTIHATFSPLENALSPTDLAAEREEGEALNTKLRASAAAAAESTANTSALPPHNSNLSSDPSSHRILQGFDRLSAPSIGIPASDIASLRRQFRALVTAEQADGPPLTPIEFLQLEERWLDDAGNSAGLGGDLAGQFAGNSLSEVGTSHVDDVLWGNILGFFWPLGALFWFARQDGSWRERRRNSIFVGLLVNFLFCLVRVALVGNGSAGATGVV